MKDLTQEQLTKLAVIASQVKANYQSMTIEDVLNRIHYITNRPYDGCIQGLKLMLHHRLIAATFVIGLERIEALERAVTKIMPIMTAMDATIVRSEVSDGPTDDEPEDDGWKEHPLPQAEAQPTAMLAHLNANF